MLKVLRGYLTPEYYEEDWLCSMHDPIGDSVFEAQVDTYLGRPLYSRFQNFHGFGLGVFLAQGPQGHRPDGSGGLSDEDL